VHAGEDGQHQDEDRTLRGIFNQNDRGHRYIKKVRQWCGQPSDRGRLKTEQNQDHHTATCHVSIYSITYHYDLMSLSSSDANQRNSCLGYVVNSTRLPYLDVSVHLNGFHARWLILYKIHIYTVTICAVVSVISPRPQCGLPCLSVTLSNIISLLIYPAAFVSSMLYHELIESQVLKI